LYYTPASKPPSLGRVRAQTCALREAVTALEGLVHREAGAERLLRWSTASRRRQTPQELWPLIHESRASQSATAPQKTGRFSDTSGPPHCGTKIPQKTHCGNQDQVVALFPAFLVGAGGDNVDRVHAGLEE
jgi:hypothetical protein